MSARLVLVCATGMLLAAGALVASAQHGHQASPPRSSEHDHHGAPEGWKFTWPTGDPTKGREVFLKLECYKCHEVHSESFPGARGPDRIGPELSQMATHHPPEFLAESIINPNAVVEKGYAAPDGSSRMPSFADSVTVQEVVDLVAYLKNLKPPAGSAGGDQGHGGHGAAPDGDEHKH